MFVREIGKYRFEAIPDKGKKYAAYDKRTGKLIAKFGAIKSNGEPYQQYKDRIGYYSSYDHLDKNRRSRYYKRHKRSMIKDTPDWFSKTFLW